MNVYFKTFFIFVATKTKRVTFHQQTPVAFHAVLDEQEVPNIGIGQHIPFPTELLNLGGGYHNLHGMCVAPSAGVYVFHQAD